MTLEYQKIRHRNKFYAVFNIKYKENKLPIVIDWINFKIIKNLNKKWKSNKFGFISCTHTFDNETKEVFLHEIIMALKRKSSGLCRIDKPILHLNRIGLDNRNENLIYDEIDKESKKNLKKKKRTITLPTDSGIDPSDIPTYVWYMKPNGSHGERFMVEIGDIKWKTTSSKKLSLRYKLEEAKKYLRELFKNRSDLFEDYSMNGDYTKKGKQLFQSYYEIIDKAGFDNIKKEEPPKNTINYLKPGKMSRKEKNILNNQNLLEGGYKKRRIINKLLNETNINPSDLPKYCYYRPAYKNRGSYFIINGHPSLKKKIWQTTSSKKISIKNKFKQMMNYYLKLDQSIIKKLL